MSHYDFFGSQPPAAPEAEPDPSAIEKAKNKTLIAGLFLSDEGKAGLALIRRLAHYLPDEPINYLDSDRATQALWWRAARVALIDEIEAIIKQEAQKR